MATGTLTIRAIERVAPTDISDGQRAAGIPPEWTLLRFDVADADAERLAEALAAVLGDVGWYADFPLAAAQQYAREPGVPEAQIDWA